MRQSSLRNAGRNLLNDSIADDGEEGKEKTLEEFQAARKKKAAQETLPNYMSSTRNSRIDKEFSLQLSDHNWRDLPKYSMKRPLAQGYQPLDLYRPVYKTAEGTTQKLRGNEGK